MEIKDKLDFDKNGTLVNATKYCSMIGAIMYLTSSRLNIIHATCLYSRYQAKPTEKHLKEVKKNFCYLRGTVNMGLKYMKDSGFELTGFLDTDYAGCKDTFKSTFGGTQFCDNHDLSSLCGLCEIIREVFVKLLLKSSGKLSIRHGLYETIVCYVLLANMIWIVVLERDRLKALMDC
ncbi:hypothetical protein Tco_0736063 [Tanacetum coccineum]